jgi:hypothetical protein
MNRGDVEKYSRLPTLLKRVIVGLVAGISVGFIVTAIVFAVGEDAAPVQAIDLLGVALLLGSGAGAPVGVVVAITSSAVEYRSGWAWEWALVGVSSAVLTILADGRIQTPAALALLVIATGTSVVVERTTAILFHDQSYNDHITPGAIMLYLVSIGLIVGSYFALLRGLLLGVD